MISCRNNCWIKYAVCVWLCTYMFTSRCQFIGMNSADKSLLNTFQHTKLFVCLKTKNIMYFTADAMSGGTIIFATLLLLWSWLNLISAQLKRKKDLKPKKKRSEKKVYKQTNNVHWLDCCRQIFVCTQSGASRKEWTAIVTEREHRRGQS